MVERTDTTAAFFNSECLTIGPTAHGTLHTARGTLHTCSWHFTHVHNTSMAFLAAICGKLTNAQQHLSGASDDCGLWSILLALDQGQ